MLDLRLFISVVLTVSHRMIWKICKVKMPGYVTDMLLVVHRYLLSFSTVSDYI